MIKSTPAAEIDKILANHQPSRFIYAPNYWQWFKHQVSHNLLPDEIRHCPLVGQQDDWPAYKSFCRKEPGNDPENLR